MSSRYCCASPERLEAVREHPILNGIEFLEVIDRDSPLASLRQLTLLVHCVKDLAAAPAADEVSITGGVRAKRIRVRWTGLASQAPQLFTEGRIGAAERNLLAALPHPARIAVVRVDATGDFSTYSLCLGAEGGALPGFDPRTACIDFSFKVECPSPFDCAPPPPCEEPPEEPPEIDYLAKDYGSFRQLMLDRLGVTLPAWKERNAADIGIVIVEALAAEADRLSAFQDAVATETYLSTARRRTSIKRHARLLDYRLHEGCNARAYVALEVDAGVANLALGPALPTGEPVRILSRMQRVEAVLAPAAAETAMAEQKPLVFEPMHGTRVFHSHNSIPFHKWGDRNCRLEKGALRATLVDDEASRLHLMPGDVLVFEEVVSPATGQVADADPGRRHAVRLTRVSPAAASDEAGARSVGAPLRDEVLDVPVVEIEWGEEDALPFRLTLSATVELDGIETEIPDVSVARGNVLLCDHGRSMPGEALPAPEGDLPYRQRIAGANLSRVEPLDTERSASGGLARDPSRCVAAARVADKDALEWSPRWDLLGSERFDLHFAADREDDGTETLRFGDGVYGARPLKGSAPFTAHYRIGNGAEGNCGAEALAHIVHIPGAGIKTLRNPLPASGGTAPEAREAARIAAPVAFRTQKRAVTEEDYAATARLHPEVQNALARRRFTGSWHTLFITVDRRGGAEVDREFETELSAFLESYRLACHDVEIEPPEWVPLDIAINVCIKPGYVPGDVELRLRETFSSGTSPGGVQGFFHPDSFTFGQSLYLSDLLAAAQAVEGVKHVTVDPSAPHPGVFKPWRLKQGDEIERGLVPIAGRQIIRCDHDPNAPENGRIEFHLEGGR